MTSEAGVCDGASAPAGSLLPPGAEKRWGTAPGLGWRTGARSSVREGAHRPILHAPRFPADTGCGPCPRAAGLHHCPPLAEIGGCVGASVPGDGVLGNLTLGFAFWKRPVVVRLGGERDPLQGMRGPGGYNCCPSHVQNGLWVRWGEGLLPRVVEAGRSPEPSGMCLFGGVSAPSFLHCFTLASAAFNLQVATPGVSTVPLVSRRVRSSLGGT